MSKLIDDLPIISGVKYAFLWCELMPPFVVTVLTFTRIFEALLECYIELLF